MKNEPSKLSIILVLALSGCIGGVDLGNEEEGETNDAGVIEDAGDDGGGPLLGEDISTPAPSVDSMVLPQRDSSPSPTPDLLPPPGGPGESCPCRADLRCVQGVCRIKCQRGGLCNVESSCPANQACVAACPDTDVCMPAVAPGAACSEESYCPTGYVCASNGGAYRCVPVCNAAGSACGQGGSCQDVGDNCNICSAP